MTVSTGPKNETTYERNSRDVVIRLNPDGSLRVSAVGDDWCSDWPTKDQPGYYWVMRWFPGAFRQPGEQELRQARVRRAGRGEGEFMFKESESTPVYWLRMPVPDLPDLDPPGDE